MSDVQSLRCFRAIQFIQQEILTLEQERATELEQYPDNFEDMRDIDFYKLQNDYSGLLMEYNTEIQENKILVCQIQQILDMCTGLCNHGNEVDFNAVVQLIESLLSSASQPPQDDESSGESGMRELLASLGQ